MISIPSRWMLGKTAMITLEQNIKEPITAQITIISMRLRQISFGPFLLCVDKSEALPTTYFLVVYTVGHHSLTLIKSPIRLIVIPACKDSV